ncbi:multiubiquitin domain-containing protein [Fulvivirga lutea]|uniref:Multiubiquitin domain-containing protein n=1 Tax=Fulvivirga lutea TaxID=2810512 RepID=A0A974ZZQ0_9BACT|nr:multiubiquitin domain-containing protein [Fulvivirga lutea]QSE96504.1 multiubiquitin domain-containing protein [Fulvivirga lutea]
MENLKKVKKDVTIIVNGTPHEVEKSEISYDQVVTLAFPDFPQHPERTYSVTYERGQGNKPEGILSPGGKVNVKQGMIFYVKHTGQS